MYDFKSFNFTKKKLQNYEKKRQNFTSKNS